MKNWKDVKCVDHTDGDSCDSCPYEAECTIHAELKELRDRVENEEKELEELRFENRALRHAVSGDC